MTVFSYFVQIKHSKNPSFTFVFAVHLEFNLFKDVNI